MYKIKITTGIILVGLLVSILLGVALKLSYTKIDRLETTIVNTNNELVVYKETVTKIQEQVKELQALDVERQVNRQERDKANIVIINETKKVEEAKKDVSGTKAQINIGYNAFAKALQEASQ